MFRKKKARAYVTDSDANVELTAKITRADGTVEYRTLVEFRKSWKERVKEWLRL